MSDATYDQAEPADVGRDPDDELIIVPDEDVPIPMPPVSDDVAPDAERALHDGGGDGDRAEDLIEEERNREPDSMEVPDDDRPV